MQPRKWGNLRQKSIIFVRLEDTGMLFSSRYGWESFQVSPRFTRRWWHEHWKQSECSLKLLGYDWCFCNEIWPTKRQALQDITAKPLFLPVSCAKTLCAASQPLLAILVQLLEPYTSHSLKWWIECIEETTTPEGKIVAINGIFGGVACGTEAAKVFVIEIRTDVLINLHLVSR